MEAISKKKPTTIMELKYIASKAVFEAGRPGGGYGGEELDYR